MTDKTSATIDSIKDIFETDVEFNTKVAILSSDIKARVVASGDNENTNAALIQCLFILSDILKDKVEGELKKAVLEIIEIGLGDKREGSINEHSIH